MDADEQCADGTERDTVYVSGTPSRILGNLLIDGPDGQCAHIYSGIGERCPNDAVAHTYLKQADDRKIVELCADHAPGDVPEPPTTEQTELQTDGGQFVDDRSNGLEDHVDNPDAFDKLGDVTIGRSSPGRCHVCLAWVAYPYSERSLTICPDCHALDDTQRERKRDEVREALESVWNGGESA